MEFRKISYMKGEKEEIRQNIKKLFGRGVSAETMADLGLAPNGAFVSIGTDSDGILIDVLESDRLGFLSQVRILPDSAGGAILYLDDFRILRRKERGRGIGTRLMKRSIQAAGALEIAALIGTAERFEKGGKAGEEERGYDALARFGFNAPLSDEIKGFLPPTLRRAEEVADLMETVEGREWWRKNGHGGQFVFDPTAGSRSRQILDRRREKRGFINQNSQFPGVRGNGITSRILAMPVTN